MEKSKIKQIINKSDELIDKITNKLIKVRKVPSMDDGLILSKKQKTESKLFITSKPIKLSQQTELIGQSRATQTHDQAPPEYNNLDEFMNMYNNSIIQKEENKPDFPFWYNYFYGWEKIVSNGLKVTLVNCYSLTTIDEFKAHTRFDKVILLLGKSRILLYIEGEKIVCKNLMLQIN